MGTGSRGQLALQDEVRRLRDRVVELEKERQGTVAALQAEKDRLLAVIASISDEVWFADVRRRFTLANPPARREFNLKTEDVDVRELAASVEVYRPDGTPRAIEDAPPLRALRGEVVRDEEEIIRAPGTGELRHRQVTSSPVRDDHGTTIGSVSVVRDITAQCKREETLKRQAELLKHSFDAMIVWELDSVIESWNNGAGRIYGFTEDEAVGRITHDLLATSFPKPWDEIRRDLCANGSWEGELRHRARDGREVIVSARIQLIRSADGVVRVLEINRDITERKRVEEALAASERLYRAIGETIDYGVWVCALDGRNTYASESFLKLVGLTQEQCSNFGWGDVLHPDDAERTIAAWKECVSTEGRWEIEHRFRGVDGKWHPILAVGVPVRDENGRLTCWAGINLDISALKRAEERLMQAQKLESLGLLAGGVAHDFNNLLVGVIGSASLAREMVPLGHPAADLMERVVKSGEQAAHLTRQMLAYAGKGQFLLEPLDISELVRDIIELVRPSIQKKVTLHLDLPESTHAIRADRGQVQQILMNLAINAAEAIGSREGQITVRTGTQAVDGRYLKLHPEAADLPHGEYVLLEVSDNGCGIDAAIRAKIFDPFFSTKFTGRGLGLAAVAGIVRGHNGAIVVTSEPGKGSTFAVLFPVADGAITRPAESHCDARPRGAGVILVIDDEEVVRETSKRALERSGYTVLVADSGAAAIDILKRRPGNIDLVILDLSMPGMSGEEALPELRKIRPGVKVFVSSGYSEAEVMSMFRGQQVSGFIQKPYTAGALADIVKRALE